MRTLQFIACVRSAFRATTVYMSPSLYTLGNGCSLRAVGVHDLALQNSRFLAMGSKVVGALACVLFAMHAIGCATTENTRTPPRPQAKSNFPPWLASIDPSNDKLCGYGVAGASFDSNSPYPKEMAESRAVENLAGIIATRVQETMIDEATSTGQSFQTLQVVTVEPDLIERMQAWVKTEYWRDTEGQGPFTGKDFTYAHACVDRRQVSEALKLPAIVRRGSNAQVPKPEIVPAWIGSGGQQADGRLCAVGFSLPTFYQDKTFGIVTDDIRAQLAQSMQTFISSYFEDVMHEDHTHVRSITTASNDAVSKGAVITHYWYDRDGIGPYKRKRTTYGFGCIYPVEIVQRSVTGDVPALSKTQVQDVRERARQAFSDLDAMEEKRVQKNKALQASPRSTDAPDMEDIAPRPKSQPAPTPNSALNEAPAY